ncbi:MAG: PIN domain-containing protein [Pseudohongiellaceae bacterium]
MMVLVDTSVWVDHLRSGDKRLAQLLNQSLVCGHPMIIGELACGHLQNRLPLLTLLQNLPWAVEAGHQEALFFLEHHQLMGKGLGYIDLHLLAASLLSPDTQLWTRDKRLARVAALLGVGFSAE